MAPGRHRDPGLDPTFRACADREKRYQDQPWRGAARRFVSQRRQTLRCLAQLDEALLDKPLVFAGRDSSVGDLLAAMLSHDHEHRAEMASLWTSWRETQR